MPFKSLNPQVLSLSLSFPCTVSVTEPELVSLSDFSQAGVCRLHTHGAVQQVSLVPRPVRSVLMLVLKMHNA